MSQQALDFLTTHLDFLKGAVIGAGLSWAFAASVKAHISRTLEDYGEAAVSLLWTLIAIRLLFG